MPNDLRRDVKGDGGIICRIVISILNYLIYIFGHQVATNTLERVAPLTHAVGNVLKRVFVIGFSIIVFGKYRYLPC